MALKFGYRGSGGVAGAGVAAKSEMSPLVVMAPPSATVRSRPASSVRFCLAVVNVMGAVTVRSREVCMSMSPTSLETLAAEMNASNWLVGIALKSICGVVAANGDVSAVRMIPPPNSKSSLVPASPMVRSRGSSRIVPVVPREPDTSTAPVSAKPLSPDTSTKPPLPPWGPAFPVIVPAMSVSFPDSTATRPPLPLAVASALIVAPFRITVLAAT